MKILIDGDILAYVCSSAVQKDIDWGDGLWTCHAFLSDAVDYFKQLLGEIHSALDLKWNRSEKLDWDNIVFCFSSSENYRKKLNPEYKAQRVSHRKPTCYKGLVEYIKENYNSVSYGDLEGDDIISVISTCLKNNTVIISGDKDFKTVPCSFFYNFMKDTLGYTDEKTAYKNLLKQVLTGDTADNYKGCPKIGPVTAQKLIDTNSMDISLLWTNIVVEKFKKAGLTEEEALANFNMAYLLHATDDLSHKTLPKPTFEDFCRIGCTYDRLPFGCTFRGEQK